MATPREGNPSLEEAEVARGWNFLAPTWLSESLLFLKVPLHFDHPKGGKPYPWGSWSCARLEFIHPNLALWILAFLNDFLAFWPPRGRETLALRKLKLRAPEIVPSQPRSQNPCFSCGFPCIVATPREGNPRPEEAEVARGWIFSTPAWPPESLLFLRNSLHFGHLKWYNPIRHFNLRGGCFARIMLLRFQYPAQLVYIYIYIYRERYSIAFLLL